MNFKNYTAHDVKDLAQWGVYAIINKLNHKFYIGSAQQEGDFPCQTGFYARWYMHVWNLDKNQHHCKHLQNAWNKYGADNFEFKIIHKCHPNDCIQFEQLYLNFLCPHYNGSPTAGSSKGCKRNEEYLKALSERVSSSFCLVNPKGEVIEGRNLTKFAEDNGLDLSGLHKVVKGKGLHSQGWTKDTTSHKLYLEMLEDRGLTFEKSRSKWVSGLKKVNNFQEKDLVQKKRLLFIEIL
jgi:group I intron endonuclease